ncbi:hypothetical protein JOE50_008306 [Bradyrhizobium japonicum]|nr:hypothetical protein [Bradyrhizobium japonicum]
MPSRKRGIQYAAALVKRDTAAAHSLVIPAKAGIHTAESIESMQSLYRAKKRN